MLKKEEFITLLQNAGFEEQTIDRILKKRIKSVLKKGNAEEIDKIFNVLDKNKISKEKIENCLTVLAIGDAEEIEKTLKILEQHKISKEKIEENYGSIFLKKEKEIKETFMRKPNSNILLFIKLKGLYNKIVNKEEIEEVCNYKKISYNKFIKILHKEGLEEILEQTLIHKSYIYLGRSIPMTQEQMKKYSNIIIDVSKNVSKNIRYQYNIQDVDELESNAVNIIVEKCGDVVYNTEINPEVMTRCIYNKCKKYLLGNYFKNNIKTISIDELIPKQQKKINAYYSSEDSLDLQKWNLTEQQQEILRSLLDFIETGFNYQECFEKVANMLELDIEELAYEIEEIKVNIKEKIKERE